ncbi:MFS transporter [Streptomyces sp. I05A-00742]|uniref:MFS transporter n=1 Tax=Streptomyces sp. I05A-00742 TaxID=2732853 RepID=UPI001BB29719|nr:MFS transporter [Streptomyces sp. I05A-00742]
MRKWLPLLAISLSTFMLLVDVTIVSVAVPAMASGLGSSFASLQWTVDIYVLVLAALLMAAGSASDRIGRRKVFLIGLAVFALASLACGLAPDSGTLIAARGVQGIGAAAMFATNAALLGATYEGRDRGVAFGIWGAVNGAAAALGPVLGGLLTEHVSWRAIFLVNLPVAAIAVFLGMRVLSESRNPKAGRIDVPGTVAFTLAATLLIYGLIRAGDDGWGDTATVGVFIGAVLALIVFVLIERGRRNPMLDLSLFRRPSFSALMIGALVLNAAAFANLVYVSVWAQSILGLEPVKAGLALTPLSAVTFVVSGAAGRALANMAPQISIGGGLLLVGTGTLLDMLLAADSSWTVLLPGLIVTGVGVGMATPVLASAALQAAPPEKAGMSSGAMNTFRQLGFALGIPVFGTVLTDRAKGMLSDSGHFQDPGEAAKELTGGKSGELIAQAPAQARDAVEHVLREAFAAGFDRIFLAGGIVALVTGLAVIALVRRPPAPAPAAAGAAAAPVTQTVE